MESGDGELGAYDFDDLEAGRVKFFEGFGFVDNRKAFLDQGKSGSNNTTAVQYHRVVI